MRSDSGFATQGRFDAHGKFRFDDHATARPAGLYGPGCRRAPGVARDQRSRQLRHGDRSRDVDAQLSRAADRRARSAGGAAVAGSDDRARGAVPRHDLRAGHEPLGVGWAGAGGLAADRVVCRGGRRPDLDATPSATPSWRSPSPCPTASTARRWRCASCGPSSRCAWRPGYWWPTATTTAAGCPIRSASTSRSPVTAERSSLPESGRTLHVSVPGAVLSPHRDRWCGFFAARESERGLNPIDDFLYAARRPLHARTRRAQRDRGGPRSRRAMPRRRSSMPRVRAERRLPPASPIPSGRNWRLLPMRS